MMDPDKIIFLSLTELLFWASPIRKKKENSSSSFLFKLLNRQKYFPTEKNGNWNLLAMYVLHSSEKDCVGHCRTCHGQWHSGESRTAWFSVSHKVNNRRSVNSLWCLSHQRCRSCNIQPENVLHFCKIPQRSKGLEKPKAGTGNFIVVQHPLSCMKVFQRKVYKRANMVARLPGWNLTLT